jgi:hypothetical protein
MIGSRYFTKESAANRTTSSAKFLDIARISQPFTLEQYCCILWIMIAALLTMDYLLVNSRLPDAAFNNNQFFLTTTKIQYLP